MGAKASSEGPMHEFSGGSEPGTEAGGNRGGLIHNQAPVHGRSRCRTHSLNSAAQRSGHMVITSSGSSSRNGNIASRSSDDRPRRHSLIGSPAPIHLFSIQGAC